MSIARSVAWRLKRLCAKNRRLSYIYESTALALDSGKNEIPIAIFQMGRVGSRTLEESVRAALPGARVHHVHYLTEAGQEKFNGTYRNSPYFQQSSVAYVVKNRHLGKLIQRTLGKEKWQVVTATRDPIARNVSMFFTVLLARWPETRARERMRAGEIDTLANDLIPIFIREFDHDTPLNWFDEEMKPVFGIDVYSEPFDPTQAYHVYRNGNTRVLLIRLESMNDCAGKAFGDFIGKQDFSLKTTNVAANKDYGDLYRTFIERLELPESYLDRMYESKYAKHFYSPDEIERFHARWSRRAATDAGSGREAQDAVAPR